MSKRIFTRITVGLLAACCISATTCSKPLTIELFLVVTTPTDPTAPLGLFQPRFSQCDDCSHLEFVSPGGGRFSGTVEKSARLQIPGSEIIEYRAYETALAGEASETGWVLVAVPSAAARATVERLADAFPFDRAVVKLDDTPVDVQLMTSWRGGIRLGVFKNAKAVERFGESRGISIAFLPLAGANEE